MPGETRRGPGDTTEVWWRGDLYSVEQTPAAACQVLHALTAGRRPERREPAPPRPPTAHPGVDLSVLDLSVPRLEAALATGDHDADLRRLLKAEHDGKTRATAIRAIEARLRQAGEEG